MTLTSAMLPVNVPAAQKAARASPAAASSTALLLESKCVISLDLDCFYAQVKRADHTAAEYSVWAGRRAPKPSPKGHPCGSAAENVGDHIQLRGKKVWDPKR